MRMKNVRTNEFCHESFDGHRKQGDASEEKVKYRCGLSNGLSNEPSSNICSHPSDVENIIRIWPDRRTEDTWLGGARSVYALMECRTR